MSVLGCRGGSRTRNYQLMRLMSYLYSTLPKFAVRKGADRRRKSNEEIVMIVETESRRRRQGSEDVEHSRKP